MSKEWHCADCCCYGTDACHYPSRLAHYKTCEHLVVDFDKAYQQGRADAIDELEQKLRVWDCKANAIPSYVWHCFNEMKEQKR